MRLTVRLRGREYEVEVRGDGEVSIPPGGRVFPCRVRWDRDRCLVEIGQRTHQLEFRRGVLHLDGSGVDVAIKADVGPFQGLPGGPGGGQGPSVAVKPPMPGRVISVITSPGEQVSRGAPLLVLEAMKMQNEIASPVDGVVTEVRVSAGDIVGRDEVLIVLQRTGS
jgi:acetyl/propionyl-CoA carboxylase alpha subunit